MALIEKLEAIGDAIRAKTGGTELLTLAEMPAAIEGIETGGGGSEIPSDVFFVTGDCSNRYTHNNWNYFLENEPFKSRWRSENISNATDMFSNSDTLTEIPFTLNFVEDSTYGVGCQSMFAFCTQLSALPELGTKLYINKPYSMFEFCQKIKEIPQSWVDNIDNSVLINSTNNCSNMFSSMTALRNMPEKLINKIRVPKASVYNPIYRKMIYGCYCLDEIRGIPIYGTYTSNAFTYTFYNCYRLAEIIFETNEDGTAMTAEWKNQTIDLTDCVGYAHGSTDITSNNDDFTKADLVNSNSHSSSAEMEAAIAANPNWFTDNIATSRYTKFSAINTINSLPDTSAYIAANGGTNTIKFTSTQGGARAINGVNGMIGNLTEEEIAVATAKGWTVSLV